MPGQSRNFLRDRKLVSESCCLPVYIVVGRFVVSKNVTVIEQARLLHRGRVRPRADRPGCAGRRGGRWELFGGSFTEFFKSTLATKKNEDADIDLDHYLMDFAVEVIKYE